jgi:hypothetical protein
MTWVAKLGACWFVIGCSASTSAPPAKSASEKRAAPASAPQALRLEVSAGEVRVEGVRVDADKDALKRAIENRKRKVARATLQLDEGSESPTIAQILGAAREAKLEEIEVVRGEQRARLRLTSESNAPVFVVTQDGPQARWYMKPKSAPLEWTPGGAEADQSVETWLEPECEAACHLVVSVRSTTNAEQLVAMLTAFARWHERWPGMKIRFIESSQAAKKQADGSMAFGRLAPEVIQSIVRRHFGEFQHCYEAGLTRDPNLKGRISVRFEIDLDGKVRNATDGGFTLQDKATRKCVTKAFEGLVFPKPEGGVVTVVYPIMLAPG